ncbi:MAG: M24 family metallopeptidase, partial [Caldilineaceae bacterium]|nr:M24 family metallopeptidase [Caldilineaceae bacterium]
DGSALTVGDVKTFMQERLRAVGLEDHGHTIFSLGRESAVPHNRGSADTPLRLGHTIIFDIFPQNERGYYHDMTRTWCLGYAPPEVQEAWDQVKEIFDQVMAN